MFIFGVILGEPEQIGIGGFVIRSEGTSGGEEQEANKTVADKRRGLHARALPADKPAGKPELGQAPRPWRGDTHCVAERQPKERDCGQRPSRTSRKAENRMESS